MPSPRSREEARDAAQWFMANVDVDDPANDQLVRELDPRPNPENDISNSSDETPH